MDQTFESIRVVLLLQMTFRCLALMTIMTHTSMKQWRVRSAGIKLNFKKNVIKSESFTFFGNVSTPQGVKQDSKKVKAIKKMKAPQTKQELQSFLAMVNYLGQHIKNTTELTEKLR